MGTSSFSGIVIGIAIALSGLGAMVGYGLITIENEMQDPEVAQEVREEPKSRSGLDIFLGNNSTQTQPGSFDNDEIIIPATRMGDHLFVRAELNDYREVTLLVDTGATDIAITSEIAFDLGLMESESQEHMYNTSNGQSQRFVTHLDSIRIGDAVHHQVRASFGKARIGHGDGLLGMSFLKHYYVDVDLEREELRLRPRES